MNVADDINAVRSVLTDSNPVPEAIARPLVEPLPRESKQVRWRLAVAAVAACAALVVGLMVVRSGGGSGSQANTNPVLAAYAATAEARTARAAFDITVAGNQATGEGVGNFETGEATGSASLPAPVGDVSFVATGDTIYVQVPPFVRGFVGDKPWVQVPEGDLAQLEGRVLGDSGVTPPLNPANILDYIKSVSGDVQEVGHDTVRGEDTTHYRASIELDTDLTVPADVWIDGDGRLRKLTLTTTSPVEMTATFELWDFGTPVEVSPPPADQVGELGGLLSDFLDSNS